MPRNSGRSKNLSASEIRDRRENNKEYVVDIGAGNVDRWNNLKIKLKKKHDCDFVSYLLSLAEKVLISDGDKIIDCISDRNEKTELRILPLVDIDRESIDCNEPDANCDKTIAEKLPEKSHLNQIEKEIVPESEERIDQISCIQKTNNTKIDKFQFAPQDKMSKMCCICDEMHSSKCPAYDTFILPVNGYLSSNVESLPFGFRFDTVNAKHGLSVFTDVLITRFTWFGPLKGVSVSEKQIPDDSDMKHIWEVGDGCFMDTKDETSSNWLRHIRPAPSRSLRNLVPVSIDGFLHFVLTCDVSPGQELMYWVDSSGAWATKKMEKTNCGGCNIQFEHAVYYRLHCLIFHEASLSLTVRKYHCKVCSAPVLGKENIIKHALLLHNGKGAYQCQFCSKFFLKLNYLEMHKNYGCSANPDRTRPLCDYCGRKFSQPQKLKVHIKRMHSDFSEVLKEFQCRKCLKILGSRATLQRHVKEVHESPMFSCEKCNKAFTNKSNLKIHMLTHSGVKPFKCLEEDCNAAYTTKQCLQFHYRKAHRLNEKQIPRIHRTIEYTFNAYAGAPHENLESDEDLLDREVSENENVHEEQSGSVESRENNEITHPLENTQPEENHFWSSSPTELNNQNHISEENEEDSELDVTGDYDNYNQVNNFHENITNSQPPDNLTNNFPENITNSQPPDNFNEPLNYIPPVNFHNPNNSNEENTIDYSLNRECNVNFRETVYDNDIPQDLSKSDSRLYDQYQHYRYPYEQYYPVEPIVVDLSHSSEINRQVDKVYYPLSPAYLPPKSPPTSFPQYNFMK